MNIISNTQLKYSIYKHNIYRVIHLTLRYSLITFFNIFLHGFKSFQNNVFFLIIFLILNDPAAIFKYLLF